MDTLLMAPNMERNHDKRFRLSWSKKTVPLKNSVLFSKAKHSQDWHQSVEATAGVLYPSDSKFPYTSLQSHTDSYLQKKGKLSQADIDVRLSILVEGHESKDIAIAAVSHVMTAKTSRSMLPAELNVAHASYWGLETWLHCLIGANHGNPASVTDLEAQWAYMMLPYASHGAPAASLYLQGICAAMRLSNVPNLDILPEFVVLLRRAFADFATQLEGFRLRCDWSAACAATSWLKGLDASVAAGKLKSSTTPERLFDHYLAVWRIWARWKPDTDRLARLAMLDNSQLASVAEVLSLEGPDIITGKQETLMEGLIARYEAGKLWVRYQGLVIDVPQRTKESLRSILKRVTGGLEAVSECVIGGLSLLDLFTQLFIAQPVTTEGLDLFEAAVAVYDPQGDDIYTSIRDIYAHRALLDGEHFSSLQQLIRTFDKPNAKALRTSMIQPWLTRGIEKCIQSCQTAIKEHIDDRLDWMSLASELHTFCIEVRGSSHISPRLGVDMKAQLQSWIPSEQMEALKEMLEAAQKQMSEKLAANLEKEDDAEEIYALGSTPPPPPQHLLERLIEEFCTYRCLQLGKLGAETQGTIDALLSIWKSTAGQVIDEDRRALAVIVSKLLDTNAALRNECLNEIAAGNRLLRPPTFIHVLLTTMRQYETEPAPATVTMTKLLVGKQSWMKCWKDLLYTWLVCGDKAASCGEVWFWDYTLLIMRASDWLAFVRVLETMFSDRLVSTESTESTVPVILQPQLLAWISRVSEFTTTLTNLEDEFSDGGVDERVRYILGRGGGASSDLFISILECLEGATGEPCESLMLSAVKKLSWKAKNEEEVENCVWSLRGATVEEEKLYKQVWAICCGHSGMPERLTSSKQPKRNGDIIQSTDTRKDDLPLTVRSVIIAGYLTDTDIRLAVRFAIENIAVLFDIEIHRTDVPTDKLDQAAAFWSKIEDEILQEAMRLNGLIKHLTQIDPQGTKLLLEQYSIPDFNPLDRELSELPPDTLNVVEKLAYNKVEISFPLAALTQLHRQAMGVPQAATTLLLRLETDYHGNAPQQYEARFDCVLPKAEYERQPAPNVFLWQVLRVVRAQLDANPYSTTIADLHGAVQSRIQAMRYTCSVCDRPRTPKLTRLLRPGPCDLQSCQDTWDTLPIDLRIPETKTDPFAVDVLLAGLYEAANTSRPELVPGSEVEWFNIRHIANKLPSPTVLSHAIHLSAILPSYDINADRLLTQAVSLFPGILVSATGPCKIPNLPIGTHQFILTSEDPGREAAFTGKLPKTGTKTTILFHGTSMERLPGILARGLRICSGTSLQRVGAAHGKGIYLAEEPETSFSYSNSYLSWQNSGLANMRLMLGCEVVGTGQQWLNTGVHIVTDEQSVMVRYVFLFPNQTWVPFARHIVPAMQSGIRALGSGAV